MSFRLPSRDKLVSVLQSKMALNRLVLWYLKPLESAYASRRLEGRYRAALSLLQPPELAEMQTW